MSLEEQKQSDSSALVDFAICQDAAVKRSPPLSRCCFAFAAETIGRFRLESIWTDPGRVAGAVEIKTHKRQSRLPPMSSFPHD